MEDVVDQFGSSQTDPLVAASFLARLLFKNRGEGPAGTDPEGVGGTPRRRGSQGYQKNGVFFCTQKKDPYFFPDPKGSEGGYPPRGGGPTLERSLSLALDQYPIPKTPSPT